MKVSELIELLQQCPQDATVCVWDPFYDCSTAEVRVSLDTGKEVNIGKTAFGREFTLRGNDGTT